LTFTQIQQKARSVWKAFAGEDRLRILVGTGTCGRAAGAIEVIEAIRDWLKRERIEARVYEVGCLGLCYAEPLVELGRPGAPRLLYGNVTIENVELILHDYFKEGRLPSDLALAVMGEKSIEGIPALMDHPMLKGQVRVVLRNCGLIDPANIDHYLARGGYAGLAKTLAMSPDKVIEEIIKSGLRGRGGAGFPTGMKWEYCRRSAGSRKYMICNADEGDPGAFMDRAVIESDPHSVIEGMTIAAYAIGASEGYIYVRAEYPLAIERLENAIVQAEDYALLGDNVLDSGHRFHIKLKQGAGAFVCGEETALLASIEGKRGMPRPRPPFPAQEGLHGKPTNINNVETLANVPAIMEHGSEWFARHGTDKSRGTKTFALAGKIVRTGLIEVPLGISLGEIVFEIGGGIPGNKKIKAVQTGGPSGGCIPAKLLDMPVDYEKLAAAGAIMGSGGMVVMDEDTCMVDIARYFVEFTHSESCGKCVPCRLGTKQMLQILNRITKGEGRLEDIDLLLQIAATMKQGALCGLGQTAPNPVLTTIRYFRDEYEAHIKRKKCPAAVCRGLVKAPCMHTCPAGVHVPRYMRYIAAGRYSDALDVIMEKIPFPSICGYVCFHPCETKCRRGDLDDPIAVRALKRFAAERGIRRRRKRAPKAKPTGRRVAVVGSGPAGLTAAFYLGKLGHKVAVFERDTQPGGTLRTGIPGFRLPRNVIDEEIERIMKASRFSIRTNSSNISALKLLKRGYDAVLLACGAQKGLKMGIEGEDDAGVFDCLTFLKRFNSSENTNLGGRVSVIGGGSSAMDAARAALRAGAREVTVLYRRTRVEMPAAAEEVEEALEEGVNMEFLTAPTAIHRKNGALILKCIRMQPGPMDDSGRARPVPIDGSSFDKQVDAVIMAVGQAPEDTFASDCKADRGGRIQVDEDTFQTNCNGVFAAGDLVTGPASIIEAIAAGRLAACSIDRYLGGQGIIAEVVAPDKEEESGEMLEEQDAVPRIEIPKRAPKDRVADGGQVELCYSEQSALAEAARCLRCDLEQEQE